MSTAAVGSGTVHVIGAGLAGLAAALSLTAPDAPPAVLLGRRVVVHEAGPLAGGRCRSWFDRALGVTIDNGNHLLLSGNRAAFAYLDEIGARDSIGGPEAPCFPFLDLGSGTRWMLRPNVGRLPWWIACSGRRVPGTRAADYLRLLALRRIADDRTVEAAIPAGPLFERLIAPLAIAALNTPTDTGLARLLGAVVRETLMQGGAACLPRFPRDSLAASLIDPAVATLRARGVAFRFGSRVSGLRIEAGRLVALEATDGSTGLDPADAAVLAVPPWAAAGLLPGLTVPDAFEAIINLHFRAEADPGPAGFVGLVGGTAEWVFVKPGHVSVTISAANRLVDRPAEDLAATVWPEVCAALGLTGPLPAFRVVKEKRATFAATAEQDRRRPAARTGVANLALAGDWTATGLPATIEGAIRSGRRAAAVLEGESG